MKTKKLPFLFFYFFILYSSISFSQTIDSLQYYVELYKRTQNDDQLFQALTYFRNEKERSLSNNWLDRAAYCMYYIADVDMQFESLDESEKVAVEALEILDSIPESIYTIDYKLSLYNHLGILKRRQNNYEESFRYYNKSLTFSPSKSDSSLAFNNMSVIHIYKEEYKEAKQKLLFALDNFRMLNDSARIALALSNLGHAKYKLNEEGALDDLKEALEIREKINSNQIYESYKNIVDYYKNQKNKRLAIKYAKEGYRKLESSVALSYRLEAIKSLINLDQEGYGRELVEVLNQIDSIRKQSYIKYSASKYGYSNVLKEREQAELDKERAEREAERLEANMTIYQLIGLSIFVIAIILLLYTNSRNKKNAIQKEFETEQRISRTLHDEVANEVFYMMNNIQRDEVQSYELLDTLEVVYEKVRDIAKANSEVEVSQEYAILIDDLIMKYATDEINIIKDTIFEIPWSEISKDKKRVLYRVIQELMINMKKHSKADLVSFSFEKKRRKLEVKYADNGVGCDLEKGNGLQNVESRIKMVKGHVTFDSKANDGFYVNIIL